MEGSEEIPNHCAQICEAGEKTYTEFAINFQEKLEKYQNTVKKSHKELLEELFEMAYIGEAMGQAEIRLDEARFEMIIRNPAASKEDKEQLRLDLQKDLVKVEEIYKNGKRIVRKLNKKEKVESETFTDEPNCDAPPNTEDETNAENEIQVAQNEQLTIKAKYTAVYLTKSEECSTIAEPPCVSPCVSTNNSAGQDSVQEVSDEEYSKAGFSVAADADDEESREECDEEFSEEDAAEEMKSEEISEEDAAEEMTKSEEISEAKVDNDSLSNASVGDVNEDGEEDVKENFDEGQNQDGSGEGSSSVFENEQSDNELCAAAEKSETKASSIEPDGINIEKFEKMIKLKSVPNRIVKILRARLVAQDSVFKLALSSFGINISDISSK